MNPVRMALATAATLLLTASAQAQQDLLYPNYYIGVDARTVIPTGIYAGLPNPNYNRLSFLYAHTYADRPANNHFHGIGVYSYAGPNLGAGTEVRPTSSNNRIPELSQRARTGLLALRPHNGHWVSGLNGIEEYEGLRMASTSVLQGYPAGSPIDILFNSSARRWTSILPDNARIGLELVSITDGFRVGLSAGHSLFGATGEVYEIGMGNAGLQFDPVFWTDTAVPGNTFQATFRLHDLNGIYGNSGFFGFDFQAVPEPSPWVALGLSLAGAGLVIRRRR